MCKLGVAYHVSSSPNVGPPNYTELQLLEVFWEQQGLQIGGQRIQITRPQAASQPAFERHFAQLVEEYETVHAINLLGTKENEAALTSAYTAHLKTMRAGGTSDVSMSNLDFHAVVRTMGHDAVSATLRSLEGVQNGLNNYGFTTVELPSKTLITPQVGVFRTNCLDWYAHLIVSDLFNRSNHLT